MKNLSLQDILSVKEAITPVEVPEWGGTIYIGAMSLKDRLSFDDEHRNADGTMKDICNPKIVYDLLRCCLKDKDGKLLFDETSIASLQTKSSKVLNFLFTEALKVNFLDNESVDKLKKK